jgi:hypothetical protein
MKSLKATLIAIVFTFMVSTAAAKQPDPKDFPLTARVVSTENDVQRHTSPAMNTSTGVITGSATTYTRDTRTEVQIGDTIYVTSVLHGGGINGKVGDSFPARIGKKHGLQVIYLLGQDKHSKPKVTTLEIIGQRVDK